MPGVVEIGIAGGRIDGDTRAVAMDERAPVGPSGEEFLQRDEIVARGLEFQGVGSPGISFTRDVDVVGRARNGIESQLGKLTERFAGAGGFGFRIPPSSAFGRKFHRTVVAGKDQVVDDSAGVNSEDGIDI